MITGSVIAGNAEAGLIVWTPPAEKLKVIVSIPGLPLASMMAWRSDPVPASFVLETTKVEAALAGRTSRLDEYATKSVKPAMVTARVYRSLRTVKIFIVFLSIGGGRMSGL